MALPEIVSAQEYETARAALMVQEKAATRALDALAAQRRRLPMVRFDNSFVFETPSGPATLLELFEGRRQLIVYHFMDVGPDAFCPGCTAFTDNTDVATGRAMLRERDTSYVTVSDMPLAQIEAYKQQRGWTVPFYSCIGNGFSEATGRGPGFLLNVFLRDGDAVYRTYYTVSRGVDRLMFNHTMLDLTLLGRQEAWEEKL
jgi:predicted dithiol-disulfide oxidoreductase (DUF899 family)